MYYALCWVGCFASGVLSNMFASQASYSHTLVLDSHPKEYSACILAYVGCLDDVKSVSHSS